MEEGKGKREKEGMEREKGGGREKKEEITFNC